MPQPHSHRREFFQTTLIASGAAILGGKAARAAASDSSAPLHLACNEYPWTTFYGRQGRNFHQDLGDSLAAVAASGVQGYEPLAESPESLERLAPLLEKHNLQMRSLYVNSALHDPAQAGASVDHVLAIARRARQLLDTRIIVTNPSPIGWGTDQAKTDDQLALQARMLDQLGKQLSEHGLVLAYHNHDAELRHAAREFHHMMLGTDPRHVSLCLDAHWIYRGAGNSSVALFDIVRLYGPRVTELHLRQSRNQVWTEQLGDGDIDYRRLAQQLGHLGVRPHLVLEQAVEQGTAHTMDAVTAHRQSLQYAARVFADLAG